MGILSTLFKKKEPRTDVKQRFELVGRVGQGSMSKVWRARDRQSGRQVALKVLDGEQTRKFEARFQGVTKPTEGQVAVQLDHTGIVKTYEHGITTDKLQFLVMEFVEGYGLGYHVGAQGDEYKSHRLQLMIELGEAVAYLHEKNFIHRDICPRNIIVSEDWHIKLIDFGLVVPNTPDFRKPGNRTGTANYMAPELIRRQPTDQRIDVFSYGVTCFEMCTNRLPWEAAKSLDAIMQHLSSPPADIRKIDPTIDERIASVIMRGIAVDRDERWQSAREMSAAFRAIEDGGA